MKTTEVNGHWSYLQKKTDQISFRQDTLALEGNKQIKAHKDGGRNRKPLP